MGAALAETDAPAASGARTFAWDPAPWRRGDWEDGFTQMLDAVQALVVVGTFLEVGNHVFLQRWRISFVGSMVAPLTVSSLVLCCGGHFFLYFCVQARAPWTRRAMRCWPRTTAATVSTLPPRSLPKRAFSAAFRRCSAVAAAVAAVAAQTAMLPSIHARKRTRPTNMVPASGTWMRWLSWNASWPSRAAIPWQGTHVVHGLRSPPPSPSPTALHFVRLAF